MSSQIQYAVELAEARQVLLVLASDQFTTEAYITQDHHFLTEKGLEALRQ